MRVVAFSMADLARNQLYIDILKTYRMQQSQWTDTPSCIPRGRERTTLAICSLSENFYTLQLFNVALLAVYNIYTFLLCR